MVLHRLRIARPVEAAEDRRGILIRCAPPADAGIKCLQLCLHHDGRTPEARARRGTGEKFLAAPGPVSDVEPEAGDRLPCGV